LRFLGIILRVLGLEVSIYNVYFTNQFQTTFAQEGKEEENSLVEVIVNSKEENFVPISLRIWPLDRHFRAIT
jgi:hypothetical protein